MIENALKIKGFMSELELQWLAERAAESEMIVEIGTYHGRSARALADNTKGRVVCIDPWKGEVLNTYGKIAICSGNYAFERFKKNLDDHIKTGKVIFWRGTVDDINYEFPVVDFIFIDGDHLEGPFRKDLEWAIKMCKPGGIIAGHDYNNPDWPAVKKLVNEKFPEIGVKGHIWWTRKS